MTRRLLYGTLALGAAAIIAACNFANDEAMGTAPDGPGGGGGAGLGGDAGIDANLGDGDAGHGPMDFSALCGSGCVPGLDADPCALTGDGAAGAGGSEGGHGGAGPVPSGGCQLEFDDEYETMEGICAPVGSHEEGGPCLTADDCGFGLGCVAPGLCRPYCCGDLEQCPADTFCQPRPMTEEHAVEGEPVRVPVCIPASNCTLLDDTTCDEGQTCTIVRVDGTTSCVEPGEGEIGDGCPCAAGHICSTAIDECLKLCKLARGGDCPDGYTCQGGSTAYPDGFGICVGS